jgi:sporulation protein YlmC with PRC-barrel domain
VLLDLKKNQLSKLLIIGGGNIGFNLAKDLEEISIEYSCYIIEQIRKIIKYIADQFKQLTCFEW